MLSFTNDSLEGEMMPRCPHCEESIPSGLSRCPECDGPLRSKKRSAGADGGLPPARRTSQKRKPKAGGKERRSPEPSRSNTPLMIGLGLGGAVVLMVGLFFLLKGKSNDSANQNENEAASSTPPENRRETGYRLKALGIALHNYHDTFKAFPPGAVVDKAETAHHGWQAQLLPYVDQAPLYKQIDFNIPWNDPKNLPAFRNEIPDYRRSSNEPGTNAEGLGLSHWAANQFVMNRNSSIGFARIIDGSSNTILAGEVAGDFQPWGQPANWRDLSQGINKGPSTFGNPTEPGAFMLMADGAVRFISQDVNPDVLHLLANHKDGKRIDQAFDDPTKNPPK